MKILFLHGCTAKPGGVKPTFLPQHGHTVINLKLPDEDFQEATRSAQAEFDQQRPDVIAGSSRGGAVALNIDSGNTPIVSNSRNKDGRVSPSPGCDTGTQGRVPSIVPGTQGEVR